MIRPMIDGKRHLLYVPSNLQKHHLQGHEMGRHGTKVEHLYERVSHT